MKAPRGPALGLPVAIWLIAWGAVRAATTAELRGKVADRVGSPLPGVTLVLSNEALGVPERGAITDAQGIYRFPGLPPGPGYHLKATLPGYGPVEVSDLVLDADQATPFDLVLSKAGELKETVRVGGRSEVVNPESVTASTRFTSEFIAGLPILGRDYQEILTLAPGVTDVNKTGNPNIHGARDTDVITLVDGASTTDPLTGYYGQNLNIESIQEIEVITSAAAAEFSRAQGGFANIVTKSGGNEFKGTFKIFVRSSRLDGDGAGIDPPELTGGQPGAQSFNDLTFTDLKPFLSVSGAFVPDKVWYYATAEYIQEEVPVNALTSAFVTQTRGHREFLKTTWQINSAHRLAFSLTLDGLKADDQGVSTLIPPASGYAFERGGPTYSLKESAVFSPTVLLESTLAWFDNRFSVTPTTDADTNGNGIVFVDGIPELGGNGDGVNGAGEMDPGEDWDDDWAYDVYEDPDHNGSSEDMDYDGWRNIYDWDPFSTIIELPACEGVDHEDKNCNGTLDSEMDANFNGTVDAGEDQGIPCYMKGICPDGYIPGTRGNGRFDTEDANGNQALDVVGDSGYTAFPFWDDKNGDGYIDTGEYQRPLSRDEGYRRSESGRITGPYYLDYQDHRKRLTLREDLSTYLGDFGGTHDLKAGAVWEHEGYDADTIRYPTITRPVTGITPAASPFGNFRRRDLVATVAVPTQAENAATGENLGLYFQDTYKPVPNLTVGLGLRVDLERLTSSGYTFFDPASERADFDQLAEATGLDTNLYDNLIPRGLCLDPIHTCGSSDARLSAINNQLRTQAFQRFTRHYLDIDILSDILGTSIQDILNDPDLVGAHPRLEEEFTLDNTNVAPRLSLSWDPWADGKSKAFASWGRYYDKIFLSTMVLEQGPDTVARQYAFDRDGHDDLTGLPNNQMGDPISQSPLSAYQVDRSLSTPFTDEWTAGFQRELAPEVAISLRYIHRDYRNQLQDVDVNHRTRIDPQTGVFSDQFGEQLRCFRGNCGSPPDGLPDLFVNNYFMNRVFRLGNYNSQTYRGWELEIVRRLRRKWQLQASYTYSVAQGDAESYLSAVGNDPSLTEWESGYLDYDQRHVVKLNALAYLPHDWQLGGTAAWSSGLPYSSTLYAASFDDLGFAQSRRLFGEIGVNGFGFTQENRNIHRSAATYLINARVQKNFVIGKGVASAFLEVYNLLNTDNLRVYELQQVPGVAISAGPTSREGDYQGPGREVMVGERDFGRRYQIGFQLDF